MKIKILDKNGIKLKTKGKFCKEDIVVTADESLFGIDTSDATATADDILLGKTAYARDEKLEGVIETYSGESEVGNNSSNTLKKFLDQTKSTRGMFQELDATSLVGYFDYTDTENVEDMSNMFYLCKSLETISQINTSKVNNMSRMFYGCNALKEVDITYFNINPTGSTYYWCAFCHSLQKLIIREFGENYALGSNVFEGSRRLPYIYIPRSMVDTLKSATNWSAYADRIRALEDYTVDGTTTGKLR